MRWFCKHLTYFKGLKNLLHADILIIHFGSRCCRLTQWKTGNLSPWDLLHTFLFLIDKLCVTGLQWDPPPVLTLPR